MSNPTSNARLGFNRLSDLMDELPNRYRDKYEKGIGIAKPDIRRVAPFRNTQLTNRLDGIPYETLLDAFGEPYGGAPGDTSDAEWYLQVLPSTDLLAIWNHKNGPNYTGQGDRRDIENWSVFASTPKAYDTLVEYLNHYPEDSSYYESR